MQITVINSTTLALNEKALQKVTQDILTGLIKIPKEITLVFVSTTQMRKINHQFRRKDYATDVLSFAPSSDESLGELIFCPSVLKKQAKQNQHSVDYELVYLLIHGILHLLGYDHESSPQEAQKMFRIQDRLFSRLTAAKINLKLVHVHRRRTQ